MDEIRFITELYYDIQKMRIMSGNRLGQLKRDGIDPRRAQYIQDWVEERLESTEKDIKKMASEYVRHEKIWPWLKSVKGIGPVISACLISWLKPIGRFDTVSALWAYCGQDVRDGRAPKRKKGEKINWNPRLRSLCWKISESFIKSKGPYRDEYDKAKTFYQGKFPDPIDKQYTPLHIHNMAKRKAVKLFLSHLWATWRELEGLKVRPPYCIERLGHTHWIQADIHVQAEKEKTISIYLVDERNEVPEPSKEDIVLYEVKDPIIGVGKSGHKYYIHSDGRIERKDKDE